MRIGILQCDQVHDALRDEFDDYPDMFCHLLRGQDATLNFHTYRLIDEDFPKNLDACDAYLITGSRVGVYEDHTWIKPAKILVRQLIKVCKPVVGICFGHQLIVQAMGGRVAKSAKGWGAGLHRWKVRRKPWWMAGETSSFSLLVSHQDQVLALPAGAECIAGSEFCDVAVFQLGDCALGFQGHPEFSADFSRALMNMRRDLLGEQVYCNAMASLANSSDAYTVARWMLAFMRTKSEMAIPPPVAGD